MKTNTTQYFLWCHSHRFSISETLFQIFYFRHEVTPLSVWRQILPSIFYDVTDFLFQKFYFRYFISDMRPHHWVYEDKYYPVFSWGHVHRFSISEILFQIFYFRHEATPLSVWRQILPSISYDVTDFLFQKFYFRYFISDMRPHHECMKTNTTQYFLWCHRFSISEILFQIFYFRHEATPLSVWRQILPSIVFLWCHIHRFSISEILFQIFYFRHEATPIECMKTNTTQYFLWCHVHRFSISEIIFQIFYFRHDDTPLSVWRQILPSIFMMSCPQIFYFRNSISDILFQTWWHTIECMKIKYYPVFPMMSFPHRFDSRYFIFHMKTHHWVLWR